MKLIRNGVVFLTLLELYEKITTNLKSNTRKKKKELKEMILKYKRLQHKDASYTLKSS